jgi:hypothetical protein
MHPSRATPGARTPINETISGGVWGGVITAACFGAALLINAVYKNRREDRQAQSTAEQAVIARLERQNARLEHVLDEHQKVLNGIVERHADCREETAALRTWANAVVERFRECSESCEKGRKLPTVPPLPPPRRPGVYGAPAPPPPPPPPPAGRGAGAGGGRADAREGT